MQHLESRADVVPLALSYLTPVELLYARLVNKEWNKFVTTARTSHISRLDLGQFWSLFSARVRDELRADQLQQQQQAADGAGGDGGVVGFGGAELQSLSPIAGSSANVLAQGAAGGQVRRAGGLDAELPGQAQGSARTALGTLVGAAAGSPPGGAPRSVAQQGQTAQSLPGAGREVAPDANGLGVAHDSDSDSSDPPTSSSSSAASSPARSRVRAPLPNGTAQHRPVVHPSESPVASTVSTVTASTPRWMPRALPAQRQYEEGLRNGTPRGDSHSEHTGFMWGSSELSLSCVGMGEPLDVVDGAARMISEYTKLQSLSFAFCHQLTDSFFTDLISAIPPEVTESVTWLDMYYTCLLTDASVVVIVERFPNLEVLNLGRCLSLSDRCIQVLGQLTELRRLGLEHNTQLTPDALVPLYGAEPHTVSLFPRLQMLVLRHTCFSQADVDEVLRERSTYVNSNLVVSFNEDDL